jgi:hypothetical protein
MTHKSSLKRISIASLFLTALHASPAAADDNDNPARYVNLGSLTAAPATTNPPSRPYRVWMFGNLPGFIGDSSDDGATPDATDGPDWLQVNASSHNPYLDVRRAGDPGGIGYFRVTSQMQLFESRSSGFAVGLRAVTPAGRESDGVDTGQTIVSPSLSFFHTLDDGTGIQGFVGQNVRIDSLPSGPIRGVQGSVSVQRPLVMDVDGSSGVYFFVQTSCRFRYSTTTTTDASPSVLEVLPGLHWRIYENCGLSGGVILPVNGERTDRSMWQVTCWVQW